VRARCRSTSVAGAAREELRRVALVAGNVVVVLDHTPLGTVFGLFVAADRRLGKGMLWRLLWERS